MDDFDRIISTAERLVKAVTSEPDDLAGALGELWGDGFGRPPAPICEHHLPPDCCKVCWAERKAHEQVPEGDPDD